MRKTKKNGENRVEKLISMRIVIEFDKDRELNSQIQFAKHVNLLLWNIYNYFFIYLTHTQL